MSNIHPPDYIIVPSSPSSHVSPIQPSQLYHLQAASYTVTYPQNMIDTAVSYSDIQPNTFNSSINENQFPSSSSSSSSTSVSSVPSASLFDPSSRLSRLFRFIITFVKNILKRHGYSDEDIISLCHPCNRYKLILSTSTAIAAFTVITGHGTSKLCNLAGFVYPLYMSLKALKTECTLDDSQWLTYWICFGSLNLFESLFGFLLKWLPYYHPTKMFFLLWCFLPQTQVQKLQYCRFTVCVFR